MPTGKQSFLRIVNPTLHPQPAHICRVTNRFYLKIPFPAVLIVYLFVDLCVDSNFRHIKKFTGTIAGIRA